MFLLNKIRIQIRISIKSVIRICISIKSVIRTHISIKSVIRTHICIKTGPELQLIVMDAPHWLETTLSYKKTTFVVSSAGRPLVLTGDLNAEPSEPVIELLTAHKELGLRSAYNLQVRPKNTYISAENRQHPPVALN